jgi:hypothetical protein
MLLGTTSRQVPPCTFLKEHNCIEIWKPFHKEHDCIEIDKLEGSTMTYDEQEDVFAHVCVAGNAREHPRQPVSVGIDKLFTL